MFRSEDPEDYPCKPYFLGHAAGVKGEPLENNPYLDYLSNKDWHDGRNAGVRYVKYKKEHPHLA